MKPYVVVLSGGDVETTKKRIDLGIKLLKENNLDYDKLVLNGFNTSREHDMGWEGKSWKDDERLESYSYLPFYEKNIIHARNTLENALTTKQEIDHSKMYVVTSATHIPRTKFIFRKIFGPGYLDYIDFVPAKEPEHLRRKHVIKEKIDLMIHNYLLKDARDDKEAYLYYHLRRKKIGRVYTFIKNILI